MAERWVLAALRHRTFFSLAEANAAIAERVAWLNARPFRKLPGSRQSLFEELDRPALRPLPAHRYEYAEWKTAKVNIDYHVEVERHWYSVPHQLVGQRCDIRVTRGRRGPPSGPAGGQPSAQRAAGALHHRTAHMPEAHRRHAEWTPGRIVGLGRADRDPPPADLVAVIMASRPHPEQGFRSSLGIMRLGRRYGDERLEAAAARALAIRAHSYRSVESILKAGLDGQPLPGDEPATDHRRPRQRAWPRLLRVKERPMLINATIDKLQALSPRRHGPRVRANSSGHRAMPSSASRSASACSSTARRRIARTVAWPDA